MKDKDKGMSALGCGLVWFGAAVSIAEIEAGAASGRAKSGSAGILPANAAGRMPALQGDVATAPSPSRKAEATSPHHSAGRMPALPGELPTHNMGAADWSARSLGEVRLAESFSVPEVTDRDDFFAIRTSVGHVRSGENEQEIGLPERNLPLGFVVVPDKIPEFKQMGGTFLDFAGKDGTLESQAKCEELRIIIGKICPVSLVIFEVFCKYDGRKRPRRGGVAVFKVKVEMK